ncbi:MAG TPA: hypothetical protein VGY98_15135 [Verrucomicrobiae bacterium]|nr:hypothetical protein [Verrucomicrobiae bacterium]
MPPFNLLDCAWPGVWDAIGAIKAASQPPHSTTQARNYGYFASSCSAHALHEYPPIAQGTAVLFRAVRPEGQTKMVASRFGG